MGGIVQVVATVASAVFGGNFFLNLLGNVVFGVLGSLLGPKAPKQTKRDLTRVVRSAIEDERLIIGERRVGGVLVHVASSGQENRYLHLIVAIAAHECEEIGEAYFDEKPEWHSDFLDPKHGLPLFRINRHSGTDDQEADADAVAEVPGWTAAHRGRGVAYAYVRLEHNAERWATGIPNISFRVRGCNRIYDPRDASEKWTRNPALAGRYLARSDRWGVGAKLSEIEDDDIIVSANVAEEMVSLAGIEGQAVVVATVDPATDTIDLVDNRAGFETGDRVQGSVAGGAMPGGWTAGVDRYWIKVRQNKADEMRGRLATSLANALAGVYVDLTTAGSGTITVTRNAQMRYTADAVFDAGTAPIEHLEDIVAAMAGAPVWQQGRLRLKAGAPAVANPVGLSVDDLRSPAKIRTRPTRRELFNGVRGVHSDARKNWTPSDFPPVKNATYAAQDGGEEILQDFELAATSDHLRAQRVAKIRLETARQPIALTLPCKMSALPVGVWDVVPYTDAELGWNGKLFRCLQWTLVEGGGVDLELQEYAAAAYDWNAGEATVTDPAPDTGLESPFDVDPPDGLSLSSGDAELLAQADGTVISRILATWSPSIDGYLVGQELEFKPSTGSTWSAIALPPSADRFYIAPVSDGIAYDVRVRARNSIGALSAWTTVVGHVVVGKTAPPGPVETFTVARLADGTRRFAWTDPDQAPDVRSGGGYQIRYYLGATSDWSAMSELHTGKLIASPFETNALAAGTYTFAIKAIDSSENESAAALFISATLGNPPLREALFTQDERAVGWPGAKTDCFVYMGGLVAASSITINDLASAISSLPSTIDALGSKSPIVYTTATVDLGADVAFSPLLSVEAVGSVTLEMQVGTTADGAPTGSWVALAPVTGKRYVKLRASVAGSAPAISAFSFILDGETVVEFFEDVDLATESATWFSKVGTGHFKVGSRAGALGSVSQAAIVAIQNTGGGGWSWELVSKSQTVNGHPAAEFKIYDATDTLADATVDVEIKGPSA